MSELSVTFLGTSASLPTEKRNVAATMVKRGSATLLFDVGEGTQRQMMKYGGLTSPTAIFITHYHPDHWLGLPGLLATLNMQDDPKPVMVIGPHEGIANVERVAKLAGGRPDFVSFHGIDYGEPVEFEHEGGFIVVGFDTVHTRHSMGYVLREPERQGKFDVDLALELGLRAGPDFKRLQEGHSVEVNPFLTITPNRVIGPPRKGRSVALTGDTSPKWAWLKSADVAYGADLLVHEATFSNERANRASATNHSTGAQAAEVAKRLDAGRLALTHFSPASVVSDIVTEAAHVLRGTDIAVEAARDGFVKKIPLQG